MTTDHDLFSTDTVGLAQVSRPQTVRLADGTVLRPSYLFDASNHGRLLGTAMGQKRRLLGEPQRVAYTHYHRGDGAPGFGI